MPLRPAFLLLAAALLWPCAPAAAQTAARPAPNSAPLQAPAAALQRPAAPTTYTINDVRVEGVEEESMKGYVRRTSGLEAGQEVTIPGGQTLAEAVREVYETGLFSDVTIVQDEAAEGAGGAPGVALTIKVQPEPSLAEYRFEGIRKKHRDDLKQAVPLLAGRPARPSQIARAEDAVANFYKEKGYLLTEVDVERRPAGEDEIALTFNVDRGEKVEVEDIDFVGNTAFSDRKLRGQFENTREDRWWRFWKGEAYKENEYEEDLENIIGFYREEGYYDARVVSDSVYLVSGDGVGIDIRVEEGNRYHVRDVTWEGNTVYPDRVLSQALDLEAGDVFNTKKLEENLRGNRRSSDVSSLYLNRGYLQFDVRPEIRAVGGDSLDLVFDVSEGEVYEVGDINIAGNTKTKEHVIRRELYTVPGQTFSRQDIQESIRRLMQLSYFSQESLGGGPSINVDDERQKVNLTYTVEEVGSDQLELSGTYGGYGIILQLRFSFNNFSIQNAFNWDAYRPLPAGDGQKLSVGVQTNGRYYQNFSLSFTEPWFRGRPTPIGGSASFSRISRLRGIYGRRGNDEDNGFLTQLSTRFFYQQRLKWPDDKFTASSAVGYRFFNNQGLYDSRIRPEGVSQEVTFEQGFERNSLNNPLFPSNGSKVGLTLELAPPIDRAFGVNNAADRQFIQYHKWRFQSSWNAPLANKISLNVSTDYGYIGSLTGEDVQFERFEVGGSPFDYNGFSGFGADPVFLRGYPARSIGPRQTLSPGQAPDPIGGRILNKYTSELRWLAVQSQQLQAQPYLFVDAANTWRDFDSFSPANLYRSAGVGARLFLPIVGLIEISYGYNFDRYQDLDRRGVLAPRDWTFQFTLGQGFGQ